MTAESAHVKGYKGVIDAKTWLESTTRFRVTFTVYEAPEQCTLPLASGETKRFDMRGIHIHEDGATNRCPMYFEVKNYDGQGDQSRAYDEYLKDCYLAVLKQRREGVDSQAEFMWVTWHPFAVGKWSRLCSEDNLRTALSGMEGDLLDEALVSDLPSRLWMTVLGRRQEEMTMGPDLLGEVRRFITLRSK